MSELASSLPASSSQLPAPSSQLLAFPILFLPFALMEPSPSDFYTLRPTLDVPTDPDHPRPSPVKYMCVRPGPPPSPLPRYVTAPPAD